MLNELREAANEKAWLVVAALLSDRAWEFAVAVVGGYMAIKGAETKTRSESFLLLACAVIISFASTPAVIAYLGEKAILSYDVLSSAKPLIILTIAASSLKLLDVLYVLIAKLKDLKLSSGGGK